MKLQTILSTALLAATTYADESSNPDAAAASPDPTPAGALWTAKWDATDLQPYQQKCLNRNTYTAKIYKLSERTSSIALTTSFSLTVRCDSLPRPQRIRPRPKNLLQQTTLRRVLVRHRPPWHSARTHAHVAQHPPLQSPGMAQSQP
jgi:hypothetical protein